MVRPNGGFEPTGAQAFEGEGSDVNLCMIVHNPLITNILYLLYFNGILYLLVIELFDSLQTSNHA